MRGYNRNAAVAYAHRWAFGRNPKFYDYEKLGGDCTNFASQCLYAGGGIMNYTPTFGWYYIDGNRKAPAWTGVIYLYRFLTRREATPGPVAEECALGDLRPGDLVQLSFDGGTFSHCPVVVATDGSGSPDTILLAAHTYDADNRPLSTYEYAKLRGIHILGIRENAGFSLQT